MRLSGIKSFSLFLRVFLFGCLFTSTNALAEQLPVTAYTVANGLSHDRIQHIMKDSRGFLWFCTYDGLSRYDGSSFTNYGVREGMPLAYTNNILETRDGSYWIATNGSGVSRLDPEARLKNNPALFTSYLISNAPASNRVDVLFEDKAGDIWAGTDGGLFHLEAGDADGGGAFHNVELGIKSVPDGRVEVQDILEDGEGSLWMGTNIGLLRRLPNGTVLHYPIQPTQSTDYVWSLLADEAGRLWLAYEKGLIVFKPIPASEAEKDKDHPVLWRELYKQDSKKLPGLGKLPNSQSAPVSLPLPTEAGAAVWYTAADGLTYENIHAIYRASDGNFWIGTRGGGLFIFNGHQFINYASEQGMNNSISALIEDRNGNIWAGTETGGALKIARGGFRSFGRTDGLGSDEVVLIFEGQSAELYVITNKWTINRFDGKKFQAVRPNLPVDLLNSSNGRWHIIQDHNGEWWVTTKSGLYRFPKVENFEELARARPTVYTTGDGLADNNISRIFEDSRGDIWLSSYNPPVMLTRWERATNTFHRYAESDGLPPLNWGNGFAENSKGDVWMALHNGGLARHRDGQFKLFRTSENDTPGIVQGLYFDSGGRLWVGTSGGGGVLGGDPAAAEEAQLKPLPAVEALASNNITCFIEDGGGHVYIGTARGVDQLKLATGAVRHYSTNDGLLNSEVTAAFRDRQGALWFGTRKGISRLAPQDEQPLVPTPVFISKLKIANVPYPISEMGQMEVANIELSPNQNQLEIAFFGLNFSAGGNLRYQYLLEGLDNEWSQATDTRTYTANLKPGTYRFLVRAVTDDGIMSDTATVSFHILPPVWLRWWFLFLAALALAAIVYAFYRYRLRRGLEMERVRTRIATDLHDDIGSSLSQIAILSEVVRQKVESNGRESAEIEPLKLIAGTSREMIDAMSDIVWAINPHKDNLNDLIHRMRRFASDVLEAQDIDFHFHMPTVEGKEINMGADLRREIYVIFKENINNLIKHSACSAVAIEIQYDRKHFSLTINDNGRGFDASGAMRGGRSGMGGNGLPNMRKRAAAMGGTFEITSEIGKGTTVRLSLPISQRPFGMHYRDEI